MRPKRISIIIPALDEAETLPWLLGDLQVFRGRGHEILVVDGGKFGERWGEIFSRLGYEV